MEESSPSRSTPNAELLHGYGLRIKRGGIGVLEPLDKSSAISHSGLDQPVSAEMSTEELSDAPETPRAEVTQSIVLDELLGIEVKSFRIETKEQVHPFGGLFSAHHTSLNLHAYVYAIQLEQAIPETAHRQAYRQRLKHAQRLWHPNLIRILGIETVEPFLLLITERPDAASIQDRILQDGNLSEEWVMTMTANVIEVLTLGFDKGMRHDAICPQNMFITAADQVKVIDYGWPNYGVLAGPNDESEHAAPQGTRSSAPLWTRAPEQLMAVETPDHRSDIYALGTTLYAMLTSQPPYTASNLADLLHEQDQSPPIPPSQLNPDLTEVSSNLILSMMSQELDQRPSTYKDLQRQLKTALIKIQNIKLRSTYDLPAT